MSKNLKNKQTRKLDANCRKWEHKQWNCLLYCQEVGQTGGEVTITQCKNLYNFTQEESICIKSDRYFLDTAASHNTTNIDKKFY